MNECTQLLNSNFYVDNLIKTGNNINTLSSLYSLVKERLQEGNFEIQSCNSNCAELREIMKIEGNLSGFKSGWEKVLGYRYNPDKDKSGASAKQNSLRAPFHISCIEMF